MNKKLIVIVALVAIAVLVGWLIRTALTGVDAPDSEPEIVDQSVPVTPPVLPEKTEALDVTDQISSWAACAQAAYESERKSEKFDEAAFARSWDACEEQRETIIGLFPTDERPAWEARLRQIHDSIRTSAIAEHTARPGYGLNPYEPIMVGGLTTDKNEGAARILAYMARLRGPRGQRITYERIGSCCTFRTENPVYGNQGRLDMYEVNFDGLTEPVVVYFNVYDETQQLGVPPGFTHTGY